MTYEYVDIELENKGPKNAELKGQQEVINEYAEKGYRFAGYLPLVMGPSGKILKIELIFEKMN